LASEPT